MNSKDIWKWVGNSQGFQSPKSFCAKLIIIARLSPVKPKTIPADDQ